MPESPVPPPLAPVSSVGILQLGTLCLKAGYKMDLKLNGGYEFPTYSLHTDDRSLLGLWGRGGLGGRVGSTLPPA